jgi:hypothetical protein
MVTTIRKQNKRFFLLDWYLKLNMKIFNFAFMHIRPILRPIYLKNKVIINSIKNKIMLYVNDLREGDLYKKIKKK